MKCEFQNKLNKKLQERKVSELEEIDQIYKKLKESLEDVADEILCENEQSKRKQNWMNSSILNKMEERRSTKIYAQKREKRNIKS